MYLKKWHWLLDIDECRTSQLNSGIFKIIEGKFEDQLFYESPVVPSKFMENEKLFSFLWFDGSNEEQEPINITVQIIAVSRSGNKSEPQLLTITHPGIKNLGGRFGSKV